MTTSTDETGFWDEHGRPAPWPQDIDDWTPWTTDPNMRLSLDEI
jgi:hypothetical protein